MLTARNGYSPSSAVQAGSAVLILAAGTLLAALAFEHWGGHVPCPLCIQQRYAYYGAVPLSLLALFLSRSGYHAIAAVVFLVVGLAFVANAGLGAYQAGAEWGFWPGPDSCVGSQEISANARDLLKGLGQTRVVRCDEPTWRFAGLSFAGWNAVISAALAAGSALAARRALGEAGRSREP